MVGVFLRNSCTAARYAVLTTCENVWLKNEEWNFLHCKVIVNAIQQWCIRLPACVQAKDRRFEYSPWDTVEIKYCKLIVLYLSKMTFTTFLKDYEKDTCCTIGLRLGSHMHDVHVSLISEDVDLWHFTNMMKKEINIVSNENIMKI